MNKRTSLRMEDDLWRWAEGRQQPAEPLEDSPRDVAEPGKESWLSLRWLRRGLGVKSPKA